MKEAKQKAISGLNKDYIWNTEQFYELNKALDIAISETEELYEERVNKAFEVIRDYFVRTSDDERFFNLMKIKVGLDEEK